MQTEESESESAAEVGGQVEQAEPERFFPVNWWQVGQIDWRRWRATRKLALWILASQLQQRNAASEGQ